MHADIPFYDLSPIVAARRSRIDTAISDVLDSGQYIGGAAVTAFEEAFAEAVGVRHCVAVGNGLDALRLSLEGLGIGRGDEVIVPAFTFYATWLAVLQVGAVPVPVDVERRTGLLDARRVADAITPRTRAIVPVHLFGRCVDMDALQSIADDHRIVVIEDAAQAHGSRRGQRSAGAWGRAGAFSFYPTKNLGALGDAGAITTDDDELANRARSRRSYGQGASKYDHVDTGWNTRMDPLQASVLAVNLPHLRADNERRSAIAAQYAQALSDVPRAYLAGEEDDASVWHHFVLTASDRDAVRALLGERGVATDIHYPYSFGQLPVTRATMAVPGGLPIAGALADAVISLPMGAWMTDAQVDRVAEELRRLPRELLSSSAS